MNKTKVFAALVIFLVGWGLLKYYNITDPSTVSIIEIENIIQKGQNLVGNKNNTEFPLNVPEGYSLSVYASGLNKPRDIVLDPNGTPLVSAMGDGKVFALLDDSKIEVINGLDTPHGLVFSDDKLYVAEVNQISSYDYDVKNHKVTNKTKIVDLPSGGRHFTRTMVVKRGRLYVSIGSSCDACVEEDLRYAAVWSANLDGTDFRPFASGLRNAVFITLHPKTNEIWGTEMGRDFLGDDLPPEEVNIITEGSHYGWPYCYGDRVIDKQTNPSGSKFNCANSTPPHISFQAHSAPLGLAFLGNDLLMSYHGSWNRKVATGYKIVKVKLDPAGKPLGEPEDFLTGWQQDDKILGRPVDIEVWGEDIFVSDDKAGIVYKATKI